MKVEYRNSCFVLHNKGESLYDKVNGVWNFYHPLSGKWHPSKNNEAIVLLNAFERKRKLAKLLQEDL